MTMRDLGTRLLLVLAGASTLACPDPASDETGADTSETGDGDGDPSGDGDGDGDSATGDGDGDSATGDGDGDGDSASGDGDGDGDGDDEFCGDGQVNGDELCDDGVNDGSYGGCNPDCMSLGPYCGDAELDGPEACDDGNDDNSDACTELCELAACGDGYLQPDAGETCDDGNNVGGDGCGAFCVEPGGLLWEKIWDTQSEHAQAAEDVTTDLEGNIIIAGRRFYPGATNSDQHDALVAKFDPDGNHLWSSVWANLDENDPGDEFWGVAADSEGAIVAAGAEGDGAYDWLVVKYDAEGNMVWDQVFIEVESQRAREVLVDGDGAALAVGHVSGNNGLDGLVRKFDAGGAVEWTNAVSGQGTTITRDVALFANGDYLTLTSNSPSKLRRLTSEGGEVWTVDMPVEAFTWYGLAIDSQDRIVAAGFAVGAGADAIVTQLDSDGAELWTATHDQGGYDDIFYDVATGVDDTVYVVGRSHDDQNVRHAWIGAYSNAGELLWSELADGDEYAHEYGGVTVGPDQSVVVCGPLEGVGWSGARVVLRKYAP